VTRPGGDLTTIEEPPTTMTSRPRPTTRAKTLDSRERRNLLLNVAFGLTVVAALLLLLIAWGVSWYGEHLAAAATVNGQTITRDQWTKTVAINEFRADYQARRIRTLLTAGHIGASDAAARQALLEQRLGQVDALSLEQLVDGAIQAGLATEQGVTVTPADVDARLTEEATTPELRHAWVIEVKPVVEEGATAPTDAAIAAAKAAAGGALADLRSGQEWEAVAKAVSTAASKEQAGDLGFVDENSVLDATFREAMLAVAQDTPTEVLEGSDGIFRLGRVTEIIAPVVDATLASQVTEDGIALEDFREALQRDVTRTKLADAVVAQYLAPSAQRRVAQIYLQESANELSDGARRVRHILYSPKDGAAEVPADDPSWAEAEAAAAAAHARLTTDPSLFDSIARAESDDEESVPRGGKLGYVADDGGLVQPFADAIFADGIVAGQVLAPVKTDFGWHVIQVMSFPPDETLLSTLKAQIDAGDVTFAVAARDNSDGEASGEGGDIGWVTRGQLDEDRETAIFAAPVGTTSSALVVDGVGMYLFLVSEEETREPDADQKLTLESTAFSRFYAARKAEVEITRDPVITGGL
jgi:parvulin-like peptidyl-prolyl isomerase